VFGRMVPKFLVVSAILLMAALTVMAWLIGPALQARAIPGIWVWDISVGGLNAESACTRVVEALPLDDPRIVLLAPDGQQWSFSPGELGVSLDVDATLEPVFALGHGGGGIADLTERLRIVYEGARFSPVLVWDSQRAREALETVALDLDHPPQDAAITLNDGHLHMEPGIQGTQMEITQTLNVLRAYLQTLEPAEVLIPVTKLKPEVTESEAARALDMAEAMVDEPLQLVLPDPREGDPGPWTIPPETLVEMLDIQMSSEQVAVSVNPEALRNSLHPLSLALYREPVDATFELDTGTLALQIVTPSEVGRELDVGASIERINEMLASGENVIPLVLREIQPEVPDTITAEDLGIRELVAVGESYFTGSSSARDKNIRIGASKFDGVMVAPGEVFSFNEHLGEVTTDAGYDESYVIIGDETVLGVGGGICQVATTAFRAAFFGGYPIVERWPHAYRVGYYELGGFGPGLDATIYSPLVDFRFRNDTPHYLLIKTEVDAANARLRFLFYSTDLGREVEMIGPETGDPIVPDSPVYVYDDSMPAGTIKQVERAHNGLDVVVERVVRSQEGTVLIEDTFVSNFVPWPARFRFGEGYLPPEDAEVIGLDSD
jgi:vancomycin resistance protein YoaR